MEFVKAENFVVDFPRLDLSCIEENLETIPECYGISQEFTIESPYNDDLFRSIVDNRYDITITDRMGNSVELKDKALECHIKITRRIPRKMKKDLKKRYGKFWKFYHPNTETVYNFS
jgi:hypothetical protein